MDRIVIPVVFVVGVAVSALMMYRLRRKRFLIAVVGSTLSGKTTLINSWRGSWVDNPERTQIPEHHAKTKLTANGIRLTFVNVWDVSGGSHTWSQWEDPVRESRYVFFLVDARMLAGHDVGPRRDWQRLEDDAGQVARWMKEGNAWLCILTVTHIDEDPRLEQLGKEPYWDTVTDQLQPVVHRLGGDSVVRIVIGSLKDQAGADKVTDDLMKHVINREKKN